VPTVVRTYARLLGLRQPTGEQWDRLGLSLTVGDKPMDDLVEWMVSAGATGARSLFDRALRDGIASVPDAPEQLRKFFTSVEATPEWVDWDTIRRGQRAFRSSGADGIYLARDVALLGGYQFSGFNKTLIRTGALEKGSNQRFAETMQWALDVISEDGLSARGTGYQSTIRVRLVHAYVRRHVAAMPDWRSDDWGLPVNQTDMAATLLGALIAPAAGAIGMGMVYSRADLDAIAHVTRYVGWLIGVEEQWLPTNFRGAVRGLYHALAALSAPDESTQLLAMPMKDDPLRWNYDRFPELRRRLARAQHLSITSAFLGPRAMRALGLPPFFPPLYPLLRMPVNGVRSLLALTLPGGKDRAAARGWRQQQALLRTITNAPATIGGSAAHVVQAA
jgi:hypothetical protein